jgi:hypothetical protein
MRKRQISNMHGGYRGSGATIDWHTTYKPSMIQVDNKPLQPIPPALIEQPTIEPPPTTPPQIINKPTSKPVSDGGILAIVGLSAAAIATGAYTASKYMSGIWDERNRRDLFPDENDERAERRALLADQIRQENEDAFFTRRENPIRPTIHFSRLRGGNEEDEFDLSEQDQLAPILVNVLRD